MVRVNGTTISITRGDSAHLDFFIIGPDGEPITLGAGDEVTYQVRTSEIYSEDDESGSDILLEGTMLYDSTTCKATLDITSYDTSRMDAGSYVWDAQVDYANGDTYTFISVSQINILPEVTTNVTIPESTTPGAIMNTAGTTAAKKANLAGYVAAEDTYVCVIVVNENTAEEALTLNINNQGDKPIYINGEASSSTNYTLPAGPYLVYYDGTNYYFQTDGSIPTGEEAFTQNEINSLWPAS